MSCGFTFQKFEFTDQTGPITSTTLFTPSGDGDYIVSLYIEFSPHVGVDAPGTVATLSWTDNYNAESVQLSCSSGQSQYIAATTIHVAAGQPVTLDATYVYYSGEQNPFNLYVMAIGQ